MAYTGTKISDLNTSLPAEGATQPSEVNDAIREIKTCLKNTFGVDHDNSTGKHFWDVYQATATYSATTSNDIIVAVTNAITITLPAVSGSTGKALTILNGNFGGYITVKGYGSETIDGSSEVYVRGKESVTVYCTGSEWISNRKRPRVRGAYVYSNNAQSDGTISYAASYYDTDAIWNGAEYLQVPGGVNYVRITAHCEIYASLTLTNTANLYLQDLNGVVWHYRTDFIGPGFAHLMLTTPPITASAGNKYYLYTYIAPSDGLINSAKFALELLD